MATYETEITRANDETAITGGGGSGGSSANIDAVLAGAIDGSNTVFTAASAFSAIQPYKNGVAMHVGADFNVSASNAITFITAPAVGSRITATYYTSAPAENIDDTASFIRKETPTGLVNGSNGSFTTAYPYIIGSLEVYVNGLAQGMLVNETSPIAGQFMIDAPSTGDNIFVAYQYSNGVVGGVVGANLALMLNVSNPIGTVYTNKTNGTNPASLLQMPWSTWVAITDRVIVGKGTTGTFSVAGSTGGAETHTLTTAQMPSHTHASYHKSGSLYQTPSPGSGAVTALDGGTYGFNQQAGATGGGGSHNNLQPYVVGYIWERTI